MTDPGRGLHRDMDRVVVWDLGNVLIPWDRHGALLAAVGDPDRARWLATEVFTLEVNVLLDSGVDTDEIASTVERDHPGLGWVVEAYLEHFAHSLGPAIEGTAQLLAEVCDRGMRCVGLSNWATITFEGVPEAYPVLSLLEDVLISGEVGITKPHGKIFELCQRRFDFEPTQAVFIDDSPANVAAAAARGWDAIEYTDPADLRERLARRGLVARGSAA